MFNSKSRIFIFSFFLLPLIWSCATTTPYRSNFTAAPSYTAPDIIRYAERGDVEGVQDEIRSGTDLNTTDRWGFTALHRAAERGHTSVMNQLINAGASTAPVTDSGFSVESLARDSGNPSALSLLTCLQKDKNLCEQEQKMFNTCSDGSEIAKCEQYLTAYPTGMFAESARERIRGLRANRTAQQQAEDNARLMQEMQQRFESACVSFDYGECSALLNTAPDDTFADKIRARISAETPAIETAFDNACGTNGSAPRCADFAKQHPGFKTRQQYDNAYLYLNQKCRLIESDWIYQGSDCKAGLAHGKGKAVNSEKSLAFEGQFQRGARTHGKLYYNGVPMYDGPLQNSRPNGSGICFHEGEPEECKYYEGKRVDTLYKQRIEMAKQQAIIDEKLRKLELSQQDQMRQIQAQRQYNAAPTRTFTDGMTDALINESQKRISEKIFDSLF